MHFINSYGTFYLDLANELKILKKRNNMIPRKPQAPKTQTTPTTGSSKKSNVKSSEAPQPRVKGEGGKGGLRIVKKSITSRTASHDANKPKNE